MNRVLDPLPVDGDLGDLGNFYLTFLILKFLLYAHFITTSNFVTGFFCKFLGDSLGSSIDRPGRDNALMM